MDVINPSSGLGLPADFRGSSRSTPPEVVTDRDRRLLCLAQQAALDGRREVLLDDATVEYLAGDDPPAHPPANIDLFLQIWADSPAALNHDGYTVAITGIGRAAGSTTITATQVCPQHLRVVSRCRVHVSLQQSGVRPRRPAPGVPRPAPSVGDVPPAEPASPQAASLPTSSPRAAAQTVWRCCTAAPCAAQTTPPLGRRGRVWLSTVVGCQRQRIAACSCTPS